METAWVTTKGQLVIPARIRRRHNIKAGTQVNFTEEGDRIVMQPVTEAFIESLCGMLKRRPGARPVTQSLMEDHAEEVRREEEQLAQRRSR
jgi:AbrB family looped-hinge helix DNA binding protein